MGGQAVILSVCSAFDGGGAQDASLDVHNIHEVRHFRPDVGKKSPDDSGFFVISSYW